MSSANITLEPALVLENTEFAQQRALERRLQQILDEGWEEFERENGLAEIGRCRRRAHAARLPQQQQPHCAE